MVHSSEQEPSCWRVQQHPKLHTSHQWLLNHLRKKKLPTELLAADGWDVVERPSCWAVAALALMDGEKGPWHQHQGPREQGQARGSGTRCSISAGVHVEHRAGARLAAAQPCWGTLASAARICFLHPSPGRCHLLSLTAEVFG